MDKILTPQQERQSEKFQRTVDRITEYRKDADRGRFLYLLKCDQYYKIGIANDMSNRLNSLQCGNPYEIEIITTKRIKNAKEVEMALHDSLSAYRHRREWFKLDDIDSEFVKDLKTFIESYE